MRWTLDNIDYIWSLTWQHIWLSAIPIVLGFAISLPIGWYASRHARVRGPLLASVGVLYTIPSLAMFVLLPGILGTGILSPINVIVALTVYAAAIMVRATSDAFESVSREVLDSAKASGYDPVGRAFAVEFPLAGPVMLAGLRVVSVSTVSLVSVGALIGVSSLGSLFTDGFRRSFDTEIAVGVIATVLVALVFDAILLLGGKILMPWASLQRASSSKSVRSRLVSLRGGRA